MHFYLFSGHDSPLLPGQDRDSLFRILSTVAGRTDTRDLVVALYLLPGNRQQRGTAYVMHWMSPPEFHSKRGKWSFVQRWEAPSGLPDTFKLIRMRLDGRNFLYPRKETDLYGWTFKYRSFEDHLSMLFAHELHHFRRHHLNLHPGEGEQSANCWALEHVKDLGFLVEGYPPEKRRKIRRRSVWKSAYLPYSHLRNGDLLLILHDPQKRYEGQKATVMRRIRKNSRRIVLQTSDGKIWRWPMNWLKAPETGAYEKRHTAGWI